MKCPCCGNIVTHSIHGSLVEARIGNAKFLGVVLGRAETYQELWQVMIPIGESVRIALCREDEMDFKGDGTHLLPRFQGVDNV